MRRSDRTTEGPPTLRMSHFPTQSPDWPGHGILFNRWVNGWVRTLGGLLDGRTERICHVLIRPFSSLHRTRGALSL